MRNVPIIEVSSLTNKGVTVLRRIENYLYTARGFAALAANTRNPTSGQITQGKTCDWYADGYRAFHSIVAEVKTK